MKQIKKALLDSVIIGGLMLIIAFIQHVPIFKVLIPITAVAIYNFIKAAFLIYSDKKGKIL